jgi:hypothetical protein
MVRESLSGSKMPPELGEPLPVRKESVSDFLDVDMVGVHKAVLSIDGRGQGSPGVSPFRSGRESQGKAYVTKRAVEK